MKTFLLSIVLISCNHPVHTESINPPEEYHSLPQELTLNHAKTDLEKEELYLEYLDYFAVGDGEFLDNMTDLPHIYIGHNPLGRASFDMNPTPENFDDLLIFREFAVANYDEIYGINFARNYLNHLELLDARIWSECSQSSPFAFKGVYSKKTYYMAREGEFFVIRDDSNNLITSGFKSSRDACLNHTIFKLTSHYLNHIKKFPPIQSPYQIYQVAPDNFAINSIHFESINYICSTRNFWTSNDDRDEYCSL